MAVDQRRVISGANAVKFLAAVAAAVLIYATWVGSTDGVPTFVKSPAAAAAIATADQGTQSAFTNIYSKGQWGAGGNGSGNHVEDKGASNAA
jgi:hypothetical protein